MVIIFKSGVAFADVGIDEGDELCLRRSTIVFGSWAEIEYHLAEKNCLCLMDFSFTSIEAIAGMVSRCAHNVILLLTPNSHHHARIACNTLETVSKWSFEWGNIRLTGHNSAASFPTGPVIAEPFISPFGLTI